MYRRIDDFVRDWEHDAENTSKMFGALTQESLTQEVCAGFRNIGRLVWHITQTIPEMMNQTGLSVTGVDPHAPVPKSLSEMQRAYRDASKSLVSEIKSKWTDETLEVEDNMYGSNWKRGLTLSALMIHQAHHRGQLTVLMRQADLRVPGVFGPAKEDWAKMHMEPPIV